MKEVKGKLQDRDIEQIMGNLLRYGVLTALFVVLIGAAFYLAQHGSENRPTGSLPASQNGSLNLAKYGKRPCREGAVPSSSWVFLF